MKEGLGPRRPPVPHRHGHRYSDRKYAATQPVGDANKQPAPRLRSSSPTTQLNGRALIFARALELVGDGPLLLSDFPAAYRKRFSVELNTKALGFRRLGAMLRSTPALSVTEEVAGRTMVQRAGAPRLSSSRGRGGDSKGGSQKALH